jgi:hypothetical protein
MLRTPDGRYFVVRGRLWRLSDPKLEATARKKLVAKLMRARREVSLGRGDRSRVARARAAVDNAKVALGERGPVWWRDGAPDYNRFFVLNTPYAKWFLSARTSRG